MIVRYIVLAVYFYNPIIWLAFFASGHDCELACDEEVLGKIGEEESSAYGACLLGSLEQKFQKPPRMVMTTNMSTGKKFMKERIVNIANKKKKSRITMAIAAVIMVTVVGCSFEKSTEDTSEQESLVSETEEIKTETTETEETKSEVTETDGTKTEETSPEQTEETKAEESRSEATETEEKLDSHEALLKERVTDEIKGWDCVIGYWDYADYDGDGNKEAFAQIRPENEGNDISYSYLYFVDSQGTVFTTIGKDYDAYLQPSKVSNCKVITTPDEKRVIAIDDMDNKQGITHVFGVKDGEPYEMTISETNSLHGIYQEDGAIWTYPEMDSAFNVNGSKMELKYENGEFTAPEFEAELSLYRKYIAALDESEMLYQWRYDDYDNNGKKEAFAVISPIDCTGMVKRIDYIDGAGKVVEAADEGDIFQDDDILIAPDGKKFYKYATGTGAGNCYRALGVKNGKAYELQFSDYVCKYNSGISEKDGKFETTSGSYDDAPETRHTYTLTYENGEFYPPEEYYFNYIGTVLYQYVGVDENIVIPRKCQDGTVFTEITKENFHWYGNDFTCELLRRKDVDFKSIEIPETITKIADGTVGFDAKGTKLKNFTIRCKSGSEAERYAKENGFLIEYFE